MGAQKPKSKRQPLSSGRPPLAKKATATFSSKATRTIIRKHHTLLKEHDKALKAGQVDTASAIEQQISKDGGLEKYQHASQIGQLTSRGGDTSKVLVSWLEEDGIITKKESNKQQKLKILEIGCLSPDNAISKCSGVQMVRIDLHSTHSSIEKQDFMLRPLPESNNDRFDLISLSLVVNFVSDAASRGQMLIRTTDFLQKREDTLSDKLPGLFLTLPLPCVKNSRYMTVEHLTRIMISMGYTRVHSKITTKIFYSFWHLDKQKAKPQAFKKVELTKGRTRNNFSIIVG
jgi:25S rRNA (adenine2142-N1)-methyltransferase